MEKAGRIIILFFIISFYQCNHMKTQDRIPPLPEEIFICQGKEFSNFSSDTLRAEGTYSHAKESMARNRARMDAQTRIAYTYQTYFGKTEKGNQNGETADSLSEADRDKKVQSVHLTLQNLKIICSETNFENGQYKVKVIAEVNIYDIQQPL